MSRVDCLSNRKFERLVGPLDEIVTISVHKYNAIMLRHNMTSLRHLIRETGGQDVGRFIYLINYGPPTKLQELMFSIVPVCHSFCSVGRLTP